MDLPAWAVAVDAAVIPGREGPPMSSMGRREFVALLSCASATWPIVARAQQGERIWRIGIITSFAEGDRASQPRLIAFRERLQQLGWTEGRNVRMDVRWGAGDAEQ